MFYIIFKVSYFNYDDAKILPFTLEEAATIPNYNLDLIHCNPNPWNLTAITGCISYPPEKWLWRLVVAYNSGFIFYELHHYLNSNQAWFLTYYKITTLCNMLLTFCLDMERPFYETKALERTDTIYKIQWIFHVAITITLSMCNIIIILRLKWWGTLALMMFFQNTAAYCYFSSSGDIPGVNCFKYAFSILCLIEYVYVLWTCYLTKQFLNEVTSEAQAKEQSEKLLKK